MMLPPHLKEFSDALATGIVGLQHLDPLDWVPTPEGEQRIATPFRPSLEASKRLASRKHSRVLTSPAPDREARDQEFSASSFNLVKKTRAKLTQLRIFSAGVELTRNEAAGQVFGDGQAVPRNRDECCTV